MCHNPALSTTTSGVVPRVVPLHIHFIVSVVPNKINVSIIAPHHPQVFQVHCYMQFNRHGAEALPLPPMTLSKQTVGHLPCVKDGRKVGCVWRPKKCCTDVPLKDVLKVLMAVYNLVFICVTNLLKSANSADKFVQASFECSTQPAHMQKLRAVVHNQQQMRGQDTTTPPPPHHMQNCL